MNAGAADRALIEAALGDALRQDGVPGGHYDLVADYPLRGGKRMRPLLCLAACRLHGGSPAEALPAAVALELLHSAFLVHDDIEDGSARRRGLPTMHEVVGTARAINVGDALSALALVAIAKGGRRWPGEVAGAVTAEFAHLLLRTTEGQAAELAWIAAGRYDLGDADYLALVRDKTSWYSALHPLRIGALIGSRGRADLDRLNDFGFALGAVFQIHDDLENLEATSTYGKDVAGDILEGKPTLPLLHLLRVASPADRALVLRSIGPRGEGPPATRGTIVRDLIEHYGSLDHARESAGALAGLALAEFRHLFGGLPPSEALEFLFDLVTGLRARTHPRVFLTI
ncbi:polyprenyl synthetase family protein [Actinoplanes sp. CA-142083]|uniref:polyprenyl synthetase family protein n=1 Tax=Actinoplanes sp. CA-142083 TaxID=3239903 RepID=UPI003D8A9F99